MTPCGAHFGAKTLNWNKIFNLYWVCRLMNEIMGRCRGGCFSWQMLRENQNIHVFLSNQECAYFCGANNLNIEWILFWIFSSYLENVFFSIVRWCFLLSIVICLIHKIHIDGVEKHWKNCGLGNFILVLKLVPQIVFV